MNFITKKSFWVFFSEKKLDIFPKKLIMKFSNNVLQDINFIFMMSNGAPKYYIKQCLKK
jgi:hypothetical protein